MWFFLLACVSNDGAGSVPGGETGGGETGGTPGAYPPVRINEVMSDNEDTLETADGESPDWVELFNPGATTNLLGWTLEAGSTRAPLGDLAFPAGSFLLLYASGNDSTPDHLPFRLSDEGETLSLFDPAGQLVDQLVVPAVPEDASWGPEQHGESVAAIGDGSAALLMADPSGDWASPTYDDAAWQSVVLPIGFDGDVATGDPTNVALGQPTSQSSDGYGYTGVQAVDGEPSTFSHTGDADLAPWWLVELDGTWSIEEVSILNRVGCCPERLYNITVEILDGDEVAWVSEVQNPVAEGTSPTSPGSVMLVTPPEPVVGTAVRVSKVAVNGRGSSEWMSFGEVEVRAVAASPYTGDIATDIEGLASTSVALRIPFEVEGAVDFAELAAQFDDDLEVWLDGAAIVDEADGAESDGTVWTTASLDPTRLAPGAHLLAARVDSVDADDLFLRLALELANLEQGEPALFAVPTPGAPNGEGVDGLLDPPSFSTPRGFHAEAFTLTLQAPDGAELAYTTDGSAPSAEHGTRATRAELTIATTTLVRAVSLREGWATSSVATHSYLFLADVVRQPALPAGLPATWDGISEAPVSGDYEMDPEVVDDPAYTADLMAGLREIPSLSIVMAPDDLWDPATGLYINSAERGDQWEKAASVELILPDGSTGFAETCGIRVHGYGWRYHSSTKKHSFRLEFSDAYGDSRLKYPLFTDAPVEKFDSIVLRAGGSKTWLDFRDPAQAQYLHDSFARDTARDMGKVDGHATYVHLYLNGLYWGLYNPVERPDADFGEAYFGGDDEEYDAINRRTTTNEAIDGTLEAYETLLALADEDVSTAAGLAAVEAMLDIDDLIDFMLIHQYTVNRDGPCCAEGNNMRAVRRRVEGEPFRFFVWDMEYSIWDEDDDTNVVIDVSGHAAHLYTRLQANDEFRERYATRARIHLGPGGALSTAEAQARYAARGEEIFNALVAESARWGDTYRATPYTRDVEWQAEYDRILYEFMPARGEILAQQLESIGLY